MTLKLSTIPVGFAAAPELTLLLPILAGSACRSIHITARGLAALEAADADAVMSNWIGMFCDRLCTDAGCEPFSGQLGATAAACMYYCPELLVNAARSDKWGWGDGTPLIVSAVRPGRAFVLLWRTAAVSLTDRGGLATIDMPWDTPPSGIIPLDPSAGPGQA